MEPTWHHVQVKLVFASNCRLQVNKSVSVFFNIGTQMYHNNMNDLVYISIPVEVRCGAPPTIPHSVTLWNEIPTVGSQVIYECKTGYHSVGRRNISLCTATGEWDEATLLCQGEPDRQLESSTVTTFLVISKCFFVNVLIPHWL